MKQLIILVLVSLAQIASAEAYKHEFTVGSGATGGYGVLSDGDILFSLSFSYNYAIDPHIQLGLFPTFSMYNGPGPDGFTLIALGGPTLNLSPDWADSFFLTLAGGIVMAPRSRDSGLQIEGYIGKRFKLFEHLSYKPYAGAAKLPGADDIAIIVRPLNLSIQF